MFRADVEQSSIMYSSVKRAGLELKPGVTFVSSLLIQPLLNLSMKLNKTGP